MSGIYRTMQLFIPLILLVSIAFAETNTTATLVTIEQGDPVKMITANQTECEYKEAIHCLSTSTVTQEFQQPIEHTQAGTISTETPAEPTIEILDFLYTEDTNQIRIMYQITSDQSTAYVIIYGIDEGGETHIVTSHDKPTNTQLDETYTLDFKPSEIYITAITNAVGGVTPWVLEVLAPEAVTPNKGIITVPVLMRAAVPINVKVVNGYYVEELNPSAGIFRIPIVPAVGATFVRVRVVPASPAVVTIE